MKQSADLYEYCLRNPFFYFDPDGQFAITLFQIAWGAGVACSSPIWGPYAFAIGTTLIQIKKKRDYTQMEIGNGNRKKSG